MVRPQQVLAIEDMAGQTAMPGEGGEKYKIQSFVDMMISLPALT